jgi:prepilin-type processing-associated H-X9-DG protein
MYCDDNQDRIVNFLTSKNAKGDIPWWYFPPPVLPSITGLSSEQVQQLKVREGFKQGALYPYCKNPDILHCPGDPRAGLRTGSGYAWNSVSPVGPLNGEFAEIYKLSGIKRTSEIILWVEENDPRGENQGSWLMYQQAPPNYTGAAFEDSPAVFHGSSSTFNFADGHAENHKWVDAATISYAASMNLNKYSSSPSGAQTSRDAPWVNKGYAGTANP